MINISVIGSGSFGTALALSSLRTGAKVTLVTRSEEKASELTQTRENKRYLPGILFPNTLQITSDLSTINEANLILLATPAQSTRLSLENLHPHLPSTTPIVLCAKGIDLAKTQLLSDVASSVLSNPIAILSGPSFAIDVSRNNPIAVIIAAASLDLATTLAHQLRHDRFRCYASDDLIGVQVGGAVKNVIAIASGIVQGKGLGESAQAALLSRGLAEIIRIGLALGAKKETFMGLSGVGDLILTGSSPTSRNYSFGVEMGKGRSISDILGERVSVTEGISTCSAIYHLAKSKKIHTPLIDTIYHLLHTESQETDKTLNQAIDNLLSKQSDQEF